MKSPALFMALLLLGQWPDPTTPEADVSERKESIFTIVDFGKSKRLMLTEAEVDGKKGLFLFDTGASHLTLNRTHFPEKKVTTTLGATTNIMENKAPLQTTRVDAFQWGGIQRERLSCPIADLSGIEDWLGYPVLGLIGFDIIRDYEVHLDYENGIITLASGDKRGTAEETPPSYTLDFSLCGHLPVIEASFGTKHSIYLGLDSGASANVLDKTWQEEVAQLAIARNKIALAGTTNGLREAEKLVVDQIMLDNQIALRQTGLILTDFDIPTGRCFRVDGLIGIDAFTCRRVAIDYKKQKFRIWLNDEETFALNCN